MIRKIKVEFSHTMNQMQTTDTDLAAKDPKSLNECLKEVSLQPLLVRVQQIQAIKAILASLLPASLAPHCHLLNIAEDTLTIGSDSSAFSMRLRYLSNDIMQAINRHPNLPAIKEVRVRVQMPSLTKKTRPKIKPVLSLTAKQLIEQTAVQVKHPSLRASLLRLADSKKIETQKN